MNNASYSFSLIKFLTTKDAKISPAVPGTKAVDPGKLTTL